MGKSFSVRSAELGRGPGQVQALASECESMTMMAAEALTGMASAAGNQDVSGALTTAGTATLKAFAEMGAVLDHTAQGLGKNASTYADTESRLTGRISGLARRAP